MSDLDLKREFQDNYRYAADYWAPYVQDAQVYTLAAAGHTWTEAERRQLIREGREPMELNIIRRPLSFYSGWLRDNINSIIYSPVEGSDEKTADQFTELSYYIWDKGKGYPVFLDACDEAFKSGMALVGLYMDYSKDVVDGDIAFYKRTYNSFFLDPSFENIELDDCAFAITRDFISRAQAKLLLPEVSAKEIDGIHSGYRDDKFLSYHPQFTNLSRNRDLLAYDQYYKRTTRERVYMVDLDTGYAQDITEFDREKMAEARRGVKRLKKLREEADELNLDERQIPNVEIRTISRPYVELHVMLNGQPVFTGEDQTGIVESYPFAPVFCYFEPALWNPSQRVQGMAAAQWSAQRQFNKRHMKIVDMMDSTISTGFKYLIGSVPHVDDLQQTGSNRLIGVDPENAPEGLNSVQELQGGGANPALLEYQQVLDNLTLTLGNVTEASLGMDEKRNTLVSGRLAQVQIAQNLMANRKVFDNIELSQQTLGKLILTAIQKKYKPGKVQRIINEEPTEQFYDDRFEQYDAVIKEGVRSKSQKDAYYYELVNLKREGIVDVPQSEIVRALTMSGISDLKEAIERQEEAAAEQNAKIDEQERMALELANAQKEQLISLAAERKARVRSDIALSMERISEAEQNRAQAALDRAKTITEISEMRTDRLLKVMEFVNRLEQQEELDRDTVGEQVEQDSQEVEASVIPALSPVQGTSAQPEPQPEPAPQLPPEFPL